MIIGGLLGVALLAVGVPALLAAMVYDVSKSRGTAEPKVATHYDEPPLRIAVERGVARAFVIAGGVFWSVAIAAGLSALQQTGIGYIFMGAFFPLVAVLATLVVGWYFERAASALLAAASIAVVAWGVIFGFEAGVWAIMVFALIGPMMTAAVLFWMARREQVAYELSLAARPELAMVPVAHNS
jgi:hypothetical protein